MVRMLLLLLLVSGMACRQPGCQHKPLSSRAAEPHSSLPDLIGLTEDQVKSRLGPPSQQYSFNMDQPMDEMRAPLLNKYPPETPGRAAIQIRELHWRDGEYSIVVWFSRLNDQWVALDTYRWHKSVTP